MSDGPGRLKGKTAIVTGAASGIGLATAVAFAREGAALALLDKDGTGLAQAAAQVGGAGARRLIVEVDLTSLPALERAMETVTVELGDVHVLVNCAGALVIKPVLETSDEEWDRLMAVNLTAPVMLSKLVARSMIQRGIRGRIINVTSTSAERPRPNVAAYAASKGALRMATRAMAQELAPHGIAVNAVGPGTTATPMTAPFMQDPDEASALVERIPLGRLGRPEDIAAACVFLASDDAEYMAGTSVYVDGGSLLR